MSNAPAEIIPLICDAPPGAATISGQVTVAAPYGGIYVLTSIRPLSAQVSERLRRYLESYIAEGRVIVLENGLTLQYIGGGTRQWPDAEHCAA